MLALLPTDGADPLVALGDVAEPEPERGAAVVAVEAFSLNRGELFLLQSPRAGWRPGKDVAGRVVRAAADGTGPAVGARVVGHPPAGGWAERVAVPADRLAALPDGIASPVAAALPLAGLTALRLLRAAGPVAGRRVLLTGASGGVGHYVAELAAAGGAEVTAVTSSPERAERLRALGAACIVHDVDHARGPFDVVLESVGGASLARSLALLRGHGRLIWFGQAGGAPVTLDFFAYFAQTGATIRHFHYEDSATPVAEDLAALVRLVATGRLHPEIGLSAGWRDAAAALADLRDRRVRGNAVLYIEHSDGTATSQHPTPRSRHMTTPPDAKAVLTAYVAAVEAGDAEAVAASFADDATWSLGGDMPTSGTWVGRDAVVDGFLATAMSHFEPGSVRLEITGMIAEGDAVALQWTSRGRLLGGARYENRCIGVFTVRDGRIRSVDEYMDTHYAHRAFAAAAVARDGLAAPAS